ncbi:unnamed protein product [Urochloa decumbens]|uniref:BTR1 n=1 Tax=Urochloa decumbens TaxID=240449 RepID=A0ABC9BMK6_9POAL
MAAAAAWKVVVRQQVEEAAGRCDGARGHLAGAHGQLDHAHRVAFALARAWSHRAEGMVAEASDDLAASASLARAALLVALRGGAAHGPEAAVPPLSVNDVPDEALRAALAQLEEAADAAGNACGFACVCRGHLVGALRLLDHPPPLPGGMDGEVTVKVRDALQDLIDARRCAQKSADLVNAALAALVL